MCAAVEQTTIGEMLATVEENDIEDFYKKYLYDFVRHAHGCKHKNQADESNEYEVKYCSRS